MTVERVSDAAIGLVAAHLSTSHPHRVEVEDVRRLGDVLQHIHVTVAAVS